MTKLTLPAGLTEIERCGISCPALKEVYFLCPDVTLYEETDHMFASFNCKKRGRKPGDLTVFVVNTATAEQRSKFERVFDGAKFDFKRLQPDGTLTR